LELEEAEGVREEAALFISMCCLCCQTKKLGKRTEFSYMIFAIPSDIWSTSGVQILRMSVLISSYEPTDGTWKRNYFFTMTVSDTQQSGIY